MLNLLAKLPAHPTYTTAFEFILVGLVLVIVSLLVLSAFISGVGLAFRKPRQPSSPVPADPVPQAVDAPSPATATTRPTAAAAESPEIPAGTLAALIAAAVHVALKGQPHRVIHIEPVSVGWAREGRREIFSSHRVR